MDIKDLIPKELTFVGQSNVDRQGITRSKIRTRESEGQQSGHSFAKEG